QAEISGDSPPYEQAQELSSFAARVGWQAVSFADELESWREQGIQLMHMATIRRAILVMIWIEKEDRQETTARLEQRRDARSIFSTEIGLDRAKTSVLKNQIELAAHCARVEEVGENVRFVAAARKRPRRCDSKGRNVEPKHLGARG